jgi:hypothetical protein
MILNRKPPPKAEFQKENISYLEVILLYFNPNRCHAIFSFSQFLNTHLIL